MKTNKVISSFPVHGSGGDMVLFFRAKGTKYYSRSYGYDLVADDDAYIIQWGGHPEQDTGYHASEFTNKNDALKYFASLKNRT